VFLLIVCSIKTVTSQRENRKLFLDIVFLPKPFNASGSIYKLLLAGKERVAGRTNLSFDVLYCGTSFDRVPAGAGDRCHFVLRVNFVSHFILQKLSNSLLGVKPLKFRLKD